MNSSHVKSLNCSSNSEIMEIVTWSNSFNSSSLKSWNLPPASLYMSNTRFSKYAFLSLMHCISSGSLAISAAPICATTYYYYYYYYYYYDDDYYYYYYYYYCTPSFFSATMHSKKYFEHLSLRSAMIFFACSSMYSATYFSK